METKKLPKEVVEANKGKMFTTFILLAPSMFLAGISILTGNIATSVATIAVFVYQAIILKNYIDTHQNY